ncbi:MAG: serine/threonine protein kinase, partial [Deltaproteobacteria bacterium HGW-Deltaproteobacteria-14]
MAAQPPTPARFCPLCETRLDAAVCPVDQVPTVRTDFDSAALDDPSLGSVIAGRFKVERLLGQGATGRVYAGVQLSVERPVALKLLQPHHARDRHHVRRFYREARAATRLESPHIVRVYDFGVDDETRTPFIAMELLGGETLRDRLRRDGPMTPQAAAGVGAQLARALVAFAGAGIVHRDLKPANIMLVPGSGGAEVVKVTDFGVAKDLGDHDTEPLTQRGAAVGTPAYMAPEQVTGGPVSAQTDLYALGCVLHELVTGRPPFAHDGRAELLVDHLLTPVAPLPSPLPTGAPAPPELAALLARLLAKAPGDRPESAVAVAAALVAITERAPGSVAPRREARGPGRRLGAGVALVVVGVA